MKRRALALVVFVLLGAACVSVEPRGQGEEARLDRDEAGLWMQMARAETLLQDSGAIVRDPVVNDYVKGLVCKLAPDQCEAIRVYVVLTPHFNATMRPNGAMEVWTGLMLRAENEAQLGTVIGHEIAHYTERHSLERWRQTRKTADFLIYFQLAAAAAGHGYVGSLAQLAAVGSLLAFSREHEEEADRIGLERLAVAGYDPGEAAGIWRGAIAEREATDGDEPLLLLSTHPADEARAEKLDALAQEHLTDANRGVTEHERYLEVTGRIRAETIRELLRLRQPDQTAFVLDRLEGAGVPAAEVAYYRGELYRIRDEEGDEERALDWYRSAIASEGVPPEAHRELGLLLKQRNQADPARSHLERYLELHPEATDRLMIQSYLEELGP